MPRFFVRREQIEGSTVSISGDDAFHISRSLRMAAGEHITVCDGGIAEYDCVLEGFGETVTARIVSSRECSAEPPFAATVWQAMPKGDKLDTVIQKAVECGASEIGIFESERCVARPAPGSEAKKNERRQRIALEAAKQCGRGSVPPVGSCVGFREMLDRASGADIPLFCYEGGSATPLGRLLRERLDVTGHRPGLTVSVVIGPEGGFSPAEAKLASDAGMLVAGLGKRILRTETASGFVLSALVYELELS